jgi:hypothetical protein
MNEVKRTEFLNEIKFTVIAAMASQKGCTKEYRNNTFLKQTDIKPYGRIIAQLMDEIGTSVAQSQLAEMTGFSNKATRENLLALMDAHIVKKSRAFGFWELQSIV